MNSFSVGIRPTREAGVDRTNYFTIASRLAAWARQRDFRAAQTQLRDERAMDALPANHGSEARFIA